MASFLLQKLAGGLEPLVPEASTAKQQLPAAGTSLSSTSKHEAT